MILEIQAMAKRDKRKAKADREEEVTNEEKGVIAVSISEEDDDPKANEDLSLKIVKKAVLISATRSNSDADLVGDSIVGDLSTSSSRVAEAVIANTSGTGSGSEAVVDVKRKKIKKTKKSSGEQSVSAINEEVKVVMVEEVKKAGMVEATEMLEPLDPDAVRISDNSVLRKLLRGPRYFDTPDESWGVCYNCGEEGHMMVNCTSAKRKKPCFVCGCLGHGAKQCSKAQDCFICKQSGHRAKDCPEKYKFGARSSKICMKCGTSGHDMFLCEGEYSNDDLKGIQCYVCKNFGHLCCVNYVDTGRREQSCYKCGRLGHTGLACARLRQEATGEASPSSCYRCGKEGHFARECTYSAKVNRRNRDSAAPDQRFCIEYKNNRGNSSASKILDKAHKKRRSHHEERSFATPQKSKQRGGWMTERPGDSSRGESRKNHWGSPGTKQVPEELHTNGESRYARFHVM
ncbi:zinc finger CCHC domain-containing protein 7-like isoform X2 [Tripterygium wilfordii]|uniref:zinc finger CCHC domain-containing protein 7-like isoform X2 n=1 Tax=Tripterygium wilfordii TaxID=458696 RepID=UPI0018F8347A|nr:zinc finger CCHC domain-containing protein 7-like isoform X2 [Tripterygium wilfordii]